jgi:hypothetical protein
VYSTISLGVISVGREIILTDVEKQFLPWLQILGVEEAGVTSPPQA